MSDYTTLESIYSFLNPKGVVDGSTPNPKSTDKVPLIKILLEEFLTTNGVFKNYAKIEDKIRTHYAGAASETKEEIKKLLFICGDNKPLDVLGNKNFWGKSTNLLTVAPEGANNGPKSVSAFVIRSSFLNPAVRGTSAVDFFLNYTPTIFASQMVPYLDVEFEMTRDLGTSINADKKYLSTPSTLRFLLGSNLTKNLTPFDKVLENSSIDFTNNSSFSGMELFLQPQTLTNMENVDATSVNIGRYTRAKPFVPLASLEGLEIQVQNAGAGSFAHKKGTLRLKIHDKARIAEFSEFIKGSAGFNEAIVWTTYGWLAPMMRGTEDLYAKFINDNMLIRECWQTSNSQFSFDASGQVTLTVELQSKGIRQLQSINVGSDSSISSQIEKMNSIFASISQIREKLSENPRFAIDITAAQVLNAASTNGFFGDIKAENLNRVIDDLKNSLKNSSLTESQIQTFNNEIDKLKNVNGKSAFSISKETIGSAVAKKFGDIAAAGDTDPFLPSISKEEYYSERNKKVIKEISKFQGSAPQRNFQISQSKTAISTIKVEPKSSVTSFGNLFLKFIAPCITTCDELQVYFYRLNDQCGPVSGLSIAEFPIDILSLEYAYSDAITSQNVSSLTLQQFMKLVIDTQFGNMGAIGYGMNDFYKPDPENPGNPALNQVKKEGEDVEKGLAKWARDYGSFLIPTIEIFVESGEVLDEASGEVTAKESVISTLKKGIYKIQQDTTSPPKNKKFVKRIHIYDKQSNPYTLMQKVIEGEAGYELGFNEGKFLNDLLSKSAVLSNDAKTIEQIEKEFKQGKITNEQVLARLGLTPDDINKIGQESKAGSEIVTVGKNVMGIKNQLKKHVPNITIGTNGSMVLNATLSSKTDGTIGAIYLKNAMNGKKKTLSTPGNGLEEDSGIPLKVVPAQLTMTTMGVPIAQLYQKYYIDFDTGTTLDNLYHCTQIQHSIAQGKFTTNWTFSYANGYGKFSAPPTITSLATGAASEILQRAKQLVK